MQLTFLNGYPDYVGRRFIFCGFGNGPSSYDINGDPISPLPRFANYIDIVFSVLSVGGAYAITAFPSSHGPRAIWRLLWSGIAGTIASVAETTPGTDMTPGTYIIDGTGGGGVGAQISVAVADPETLGTITILNAGQGYGTVPTFDLAAAGGTPAVLTATLTTPGPVAQGTDLSQETVQIGGFGGVY
jgi:hypothetical protein